MSDVHGQIREMIPYHVEGRGEMSFKNSVRSKESLKAQADPDSASDLDAAPSISHKVALSLRITTASYFHDQNIALAN